MITIPKAEIIRIQKGHNRKELPYRKLKLFESKKDIIERSWKQNSDGEMKTDDGLENCLDVNAVTVVH